MSFVSAIAHFRREQAAQFTTTAAVLRDVGEPVFNETTGEYTQETETVYSGVCKIRPGTNPSADETEAGETQIGRPDFDGKFPVDTDIQRGDIVTVTASTYDVGMVGKSYTVTEAQNDEWQIARAVVLEEYVVPALNEGS